MADSLIAGIALLHDLPLFTRNHSHFDRVPGLTLVEIERDHPKRR
jgi:predicted nucleic acid-binding protein